MNYKSRYFNVIERIEFFGYLRKISKDITKLKAEYNYWYELPENIQHFFVQPFGFHLDGEVAYYYMEELLVKNAGELLVSGELSDASFDRLFKKIQDFRKVLPDEPVLESQVDANAKLLVLQKTKERIEELKKTAWYESNYALKLEEKKITLDGLYDELEEKFYQHYVNRTIKRIILSHGDLTLSNILWEDSIQLMKLIDPKGQDFMYMDEYYDLAKLSQSINGNYDDIVSGNYFFDINSATLSIHRQPNEHQKLVFKHYLAQQNVDFKLLRVYEASLFLSMLPFHIEDQQRIAAFLVNCKKILKSL